MRKLIVTIFALSLTFILFPAPGAIAGDLPEVMGVTLGGAYDGVRDLYVQNGRTIAQYNDIPNRGVPATIGPEKVSLEKQHPYRECDEFELGCLYRFGTTLVDIRGAGRTLYRVFDGKVYEIDIAFDVNMLDEHLKSLNNRYGKPTEGKGGSSASEVTTRYKWRSRDMNIEIKRADQGPLSDSFYLTYTYPPVRQELEKALEEAKSGRRKKEEGHF
jgi:hypothetical protein